MPDYPFEDVKTGEVIDLFFSMADAPSIGDVVVAQFTLDGEFHGLSEPKCDPMLLIHNDTMRLKGPPVTNGRVLRRIVSPHSAQTDDNCTTKRYPVVSRQLPRHAFGDDAPHDDKGRPIITSRKHERELAAKYDLTRRED